MGLCGYSLILLQVLSLCGATEYYVRPTEPTNTSCPGQPCLTINQYTNDPDHYFTSNTVFKFLLGTHRLSRPVRMKYVQNVSLEAYVYDPNDTHMYSDPLLIGWFSRSLADCTHDNAMEHCAALRFYNVHNISIRGIRVNVMLQNAFGIVIKQSSTVFIQTRVTCFQPNTYGVVLDQDSWVNISSTSVTNCAYGVLLQNTTFAEVYSTTVRNCSVCGLCLSRVSHVTLHATTAVFNGIGLLSNNTLNSSITDTNAHYNSQSGVDLLQTNNTQITKTNVMQNKGIGIKVMNSKKYHHF